MSVIPSDESVFERATIMRFKLLALLGLAALAANLHAAEPIGFRVCAWNMEGNGSATADLLKAQLGEKQGVDLWGLSEVRADRFDDYLDGAALGENSTFKVIEGASGGDKTRLAIIYDTSVFELVGEPVELTLVQLGSDNLRAPLVARFRGRQTQQEFFFMVNHLKCCGEGKNKRRQQCKLISDWAEDQDVPVLMCGDLNIPLDVDDLVEGEPITDSAFVELTQQGPFVWLEPEVLAKTQAHPDFNSILDYILVANAPVADWTFQARILHREEDRPIQEGEDSGFADNNSSTDHRPVDAILTLNATATQPAPLVADLNEATRVAAAAAAAAPSGQPTPATGVSTVEILRRIDALEAELKQLRGMLQNEE